MIIAQKNTSYRIIQNDFNSFHKILIHTHTHNFFFVFPLHLPFEMYLSNVYVNISFCSTFKGSECVCVCFFPYVFTDGIKMKSYY